MSARRTLAILGYHSVGPPSPGGWKTWFYIPETVFAQQLHTLRADGWTVISLRECLIGLDDPDSLPEQSALLTFDDAYQSLRTVALPILQTFGAPGVVFVPTNYIGDVNAFEPEGWAPREPICSWADLRALAQAGIAVQSHGARHRTLSDLTSGQIEAELLHSRETLESGLGTAVEMFSFPYGDGGEDRAAVDGALRGAGYRAACLYDGGLNVLDGTVDRYRLSRLQMGPDTDLRAALRGQVEA